MKVTDLGKKRQNDMKKSISGANDERRQELMISMLQTSMAVRVSKDKSIMRNLLGGIPQNDEQGGSAPNSRR